MMTEMTETEDSESRAPVATKTNKNELPNDQSSDSQDSGPLDWTSKGQFMEKNQAFASEIEAQSSSRPVFENNCALNYKLTTNSFRNQETRVQKMAMMEDSSEEEESTHRGELSKDHLKGLMMSQFKEQTKDLSRDTVFSKRNASRGKSGSSNEHSKDRKGPYLEKIEIRAPQECLKQDSNRDNLNLSKLFRPGNLKNSDTSFTKDDDIGKNTNILRSFQEDTQVYSQFVQEKQTGGHKGTIINELDQEISEPSTLFGQKVDLNKLLSQKSQPEPDPMLHIFQMPVGQELSETEEMLKKEKLKDRLDKLRTLVSKPGFR